MEKDLKRPAARSELQMEQSPAKRRNQRGDDKAGTANDNERITIKKVPRKLNDVDGKLKLSLNSIDSSSGVGAGGGDKGYTDTESYIDRVNDAIAFLPMSEKKEYLEAMEKAPSLVNAESKLEIFLLSEKYTVGFAAMRLLAYWRFRKQYFGEARYLKTMSLNYDGILTDEDVNILKAGFCVFLPNDTKERSILYLDVELIPPDSDPSCITRCLFYLMHMAGKNHNNIDQGLSCLIMVNPLNLQKNFHLLTTLRTMVENAIPVKVRKLYIIHSPNDEQSRDFVEAIIPSVVKVCGSEMGRSVHPILSKNVADFLEQAKSHDLRQEGIPIQLGGQWTRALWDKWIENEKSPEITQRNHAMATTSVDVLAHADHILSKPQDVDTEFIETDGNIQKKLAQFLDALQMIPYAEKEVYLEALDKCPYLIETESDPIKFLRYEKFNPWEAARRLANYWHYRKMIFKERTFLPMNQTGKGALDQNAIEVMKTGAYTCLRDTGGRPVIYIDRSRLSENVHSESCVRALFYLLTSLSNEEIAIREGFTFLVAISRSIAARPYRQSAYMLGNEIVFRASPIRRSELIFISLTSEDEAKTFDESVIKTKTQMLSGGGTFQLFTSKQESLKFLQEMGISEDGIPELLGGKWSDKDVLLWQQSQVLLEEQKHDAILQKNEDMILKHNNHSDELSIDDADTDASHSSRFAVLEEALDLIPPDDRSDLTFVRTSVPALISTESDPKWFYIADKKDPWAAARRIVTYWEKRKILFGNRTFKPMNMIGDGALDDADIKLATSGVFAQLPNDKAGRPVLFCDLLKLQKIAHTKDSWQRSLFYWMQIVSENISSRNLGLVYIQLVDVRSFDRMQYRFALELLEGVFPCRVHAIHLIRSPREDKKQAFLDVVVPLAVQMAGPSLHPLVTFHVSDTSEELLDSLQAIGFRKEVLPESVGGLWTYAEDFAVTKENRLLIEQERQLSFTAESDDAKSVEKSTQVTTLPIGDTIVDVPARGLMELGHALHLISADQKSAFLRAKSEVPYLVQRESHPLKFLAFEKYDAVAAAYRLVRYWQRREIIFGDRAFLPMTQTGNGALTDEDIRVLKTGWVSILADDTHGCPVIVFDRSRLDSSMLQSPSRARNLFYILSVASENAVAQTEGGIYVGVFGKQSMEYDPKFFKFFSEFILDRSGSILFRLKRLHVLCTGSSSDMRHLFGAFLPRFRQILGKKTGRKVLVHTADSKRGLIGELAIYGLTGQCLPSSVGGTWNYTQFAEWGAKRKLKEQEEERIDKQNMAQTHRPNSEVLEKLELKAPRNAANNSEVRSAVRECLAELVRAIPLLSSDDRADFEEASAIVPELVEVESNALKYHCIVDYNTWSAAHKLALYWKTRKSLFGDRAFLPMNQTGEGALNRDDVVMLSSGCIIVLPRDSQGRSVIFIDSARVASFDVATCQRVAFYLYSIISENEKSQSDGVVSLILMSKEADDTSMRELIDLAENVLPLKSQAVHMIRPPYKSTEKGFLSSLVPFAFQILGRRSDKKSKLHVCNSKEELLVSLGSHGLPARGLPASLGGEWTFERFSQWQDLRVRFEWDLPAGPSHKGAHEAVDYEVKRYSDLTNDEKIERKRRMNVIHSRRKRERQRIEVQVLKEQVDGLEKQKQYSMQEYNHLKSLVKEAVEIIKVTKQDEDDRKPAARNDIAQRKVKSPKNKSPKNKSPKNKSPEPKIRRSRDDESTVQSDQVSQPSAVSQSHQSVYGTAKSQQLSTPQQAVHQLNEARAPATSFASARDNNNYLQSQQSGTLLNQVAQNAQTHTSYNIPQSNLVNNALLFQQDNNNLISSDILSIARLLQSRQSIPNPQPTGNSSIASFLLAQQQLQQQNIQHQQQLELLRRYRLNQPLSQAPFVARSPPLDPFIESLLIQRHLNNSLNNNNNSSNFNNINFHNSNSNNSNNNSNQGNSQFFPRQF